MSYPRKILLIVLLSALAAPVTAAIVEYSLDQMVGGSEALVRGRVVSLHCHWLDGPGSIIVTDVGFAVAESWLGSLRSGQTLEFQVVGGEVGGIGQRREHEPVFRLGEEAVLFLWTRPDQDRLSIFNAEQGKYRIIGDTVVGLRQEPIALSEFHRQIEGALQRQGR
ncbi:MAG: hypothetical protein ABIF77_19260 [bacterium]